MSTPERRRANRRLGLVLGAVAVAMFGFGFALAPLYDLLCQVTGIGGKVALTPAAASSGMVDPDRRVTLEFTGNAVAGLPWEFRALTRRIEARPGELVEARYYVRNNSAEPITAQAIPSVTPGVASAQVRKLECFCFAQQTLKPGEARELPVRFVVEPALERDVHTITLSYAFFNTDKAQARRFGGEGSEHAAAHAHAHGG